ncbi:MAG: hypothetical protein HY275_07125 [Gemmatimonadetes bacterium]|nr:hypothetical protein [Gemmatimonadota bacterium]
MRGARRFLLSLAVVAACTARGAGAQQRGTMEFGVFASYSSFDPALDIVSGWGAGGRIGMYAARYLAVEFEGGGGDVARTFNRTNVNVGNLSMRLLLVPVQLGRVALLAGLGGDFTDTFEMQSYGVHALLGLRVALTDALAVRVDGIDSYLANGRRTNAALHIGLSVLRSAGGRPVTAQRPDSVSAGETRRLRASETGYDALRDSLDANRAVPRAASSTSALAIMEAMIYFAGNSARDTQEASHRRAEFRLLVADPWLKAPLKDAPPVRTPAS